jgi:hypothetical protein
MTPRQLSEPLWQFAARILGKSIATAKAGRRQLPGDGLETTLAITDDKFSMTNSQLKGPKS